MRLLSLSFLVLTMIFAACQRDPQGLEIIVIEDNTAPPGLNVPLVIKQNYINKLYISLLGRKPTSVENEAALATLDGDNASTSMRKNLIAQVQSETAYYERQYEIARVDILSNLDTADITTQINIYQSLKQDPRYADFIDLIEYEQQRLIRLKQVPYALPAKLINRIEMHRRCADNSIYDEINMGTQNFVLSLFETFLGRYPTVAEEAAASQMVDGINTIFFGEEGDSKTEMIEIFFDSDNYYEGAVLEIYEDFLFRSPNSVEMSEATKLYRLSGDYEELIQEILSSDEYMGLD
ncbi:MAG: hypothetical protein AAFQ83_04150 [Bacteroidota bacterium]